MRSHLRNVLLAGSLVAASLGPAMSAQAAEPKPNTPIEHFVVLMQENHSFDNYFGTYPGADGIPEGTCMPYDPKDKDGKCLKPFRLGNRAVQDLAHSSEVARLQQNGGKMNGFISAFNSGGNDVQANVMGHYDDKDIPFYWNIADEYALFDRFFTSSAGGSVSNHMYWVTGQSGAKSPKEEYIPEKGFDVDTIFDRLEEKGISWKFYVQNYDPKITYRSKALGDRGSQVVWVPLLNYARFLDDPKLKGKIVDMSEYYKDLERGTLPSVAYIAPSGSSEHPPGSIKAGQTFLRTLINGLMRSDSWKSSAFMWTYDDWGGWYDHVEPPKVDEWGYGFRAPALLVSPYARRGHIESSTLDFTSMLKFIEENWDLKPLAERDAKAKSIAPAFDFKQPPRPAKILGVERGEDAVKEPRRHVIYIAYGIAVLIALFTVAGAWLRGRRPTKRPPEDREKVAA